MVILNCRAKRFVATAVVLLSIALSPIWSDKILVSTSLTRNPVGLREKVYLSIEVGYPDAAKVRVVKSLWPDGLSLLSGPTMRSFTDPQDEENNGEEPEKGHRKLHQAVEQVFEHFVSCGGSNRRRHGGMAAAGLLN